MPAGPEPLGLAYFAGVKLAGYTFAGYALNRFNNFSKPPPILFGTARTVLGLAAGVSFTSLVSHAGLQSSGIYFYLALAPVRLAEWLFILWWFYVRSGLGRGRWLGCSAVGSAWSYALDIPAIMAMFMLPGGAWIC